MDESLELTVHYNNNELRFPLRMIKWGYTHRFAVTIDEADVLFEPDEEGSYRALIEDKQQAKVPPVALLQAISDTLTLL